MEIPHLYEKEMMLLACSCRTMNFVLFVGVARPMLDDKIANCILAISDSDCKAFMRLDKLANRYLLPVYQDLLLHVQTMVLFYIYI